MNLNIGNIGKCGDIHKYVLLVGGFLIVGSYFYIKIICDKIYISLRVENENS